jgi:hypothetical protein
MASRRLATLDLRVMDCRARISIFPCSSRHCAKHGQKIPVAIGPFLGRAERNRNCAFQPIHPLRKVKIVTPANKEMEVISHHHVFTNDDTKLVSSSADIAFERAVRFV